MKLGKEEMFAINKEQLSASLGFVTDYIVD